MTGSTHAVQGKSLPSTPNLRYLKEESKDILKAHKNGDASCCGTLRHLREFRQRPGEDILKAPVTLQDVQFALALEYGFRGWTDLKRFVEHVENTHTKTEEELNIATFRIYNDAVNRGELAHYLVTPDCLMHYDDETILYDEACRSWEPPADMDPKLIARHTIEDIMASGNKVIARMIVEPFMYGAKQRVHYIGIWRLVGGRCAESWIPQQKPRAQSNDVPPDTRPAMSWLDEQTVQSGRNEEIRYVDFLLREMSKSTPTSVSFSEDERLPEVKHPETGAAMETTFEHLLEWCRGKVVQGKRLHFRYEDKYYIVHISVEEDPKVRCRIDVEKWEKK